MTNYLHPISMFSLLQDIAQALPNLLNVDFGPRATLCDMCRTIFSGYINLRKSRSGETWAWLNHHQTRIGLVRAAFESCYLCFYIWAELEIEELSPIGFTAKGQEYSLGCNLSVKDDGHIELNFLARSIVSGLPRLQESKIFGSFELEPLHSKFVTPQCLNLQMIS
jgi:hypothetical protein